MLEALKSFVVLQAVTPRGDGLYLTQAVIYEQSGLVLAEYDVIEQFETDPLLLATGLYQVEIFNGVSVDPTYVSVEQIAAFTDLNVMVFKLIDEGPWPFAELLGASSLKPEDDVYAIGINERERYSSGPSTAPESTGPQILHGKIISVEPNDGVIEIEHTVDLAGYTGTSPLFNRDGRLIGMNMRSARVMGPDGFEPHTFAVAVGDYAEQINFLVGLAVQ